jgi:FkbH-like protein
MSQQIIDPSLPAAHEKHNGAAFLAPTELAIAPLQLTRVAFVGSCHLVNWGFHANNPSGAPVDVINTNYGSRPPPYDPERPYDFQVVQLPLRSLIPEGFLGNLPISTEDAHRDAYAAACDRMEFQLQNLMTWNTSHGVLTFVANFLAPQRNSIGCLFPRFDLRNPEYFVTRLNEQLEALVAKSRNAYVLDLDRISASLGRRYAQDDVVTSNSHNAALMPGKVITDRIEPMARLADHFEVSSRGAYPNAIWAEIVAMHRVIRQADAVKAVILDLDDTLWNGVSGDMAEVDYSMIEGWPIGVAEALLYLKKRGILLAIISKNDESRIREIWPKIYGRRLSLSDFAAIRINWRPKAENMADILAGMNILPRSALFVDDNPVERKAMQHAYPDMRILGRHPYYLRHTLLWAPETQIVSLTDESARRTEMVQRQFERENYRNAMSREEFLGTAAPTVKLKVINSTDDARLPRVLELLNKTNQFNTTGRRWTLEDLHHFLNQGGLLYTFEVEDNFGGNYGLVGVVATSGCRINQWVMSCRVLGLEIEEAVMATIVGKMRINGAIQVTGELVETDLNFPCRDLFSRCGFDGNGPSWTLPDQASLDVPSHVTVDFLL